MTIINLMLKDMEAIYMKTALVLGLNGGFGGSVTEELLDNGWSVTALVRSKKSVNTRFKDVRLIEGDANNYADLINACAGIDVLVYGINVPYDQWDSQSVKLLSTSISVAIELKLTILYPENVYSFNPSNQSTFTPLSKLDPPTRLGKIRAPMLEMLQKATSEGCKVITVRGGDFIGELASGSWFNRLLKVSSSEIQLSCPSKHKDTIHTWAVLTDMAKLSVCLLENREKLPEFHCEHHKGVRASFNDLAKTIENVSNKRVKVVSFPWWLLSIGGVFAPLPKLLNEMRYLWDKPLLLENDTKNGVCQNTQKSELEREIKAVLNAKEKK